MLSQNLEQKLKAAKELGLSHGAIQWIESGEHCVAALSIFSIVTKCELVHHSLFDVPKNVEDFRRCRLLFEVVPEIRPGFSAIANVSNAFFRLYKNWYRLCNSMDAETPDWRTGRGNPARTNEAIKAINEFE